MTDERRQAVAKHLQELYEEESWEVGSRLARAAKAREDGYPEVAAVMEEVAHDEARHLSLVVRLLRPEEVERDAERADKVLKGIEGKRLTYRRAGGREARH